MATIAVTSIGTASEAAVVKKKRTNRQRAAVTSVAPTPATAVAPAPAGPTPSSPSDVEAAIGRQLLDRVNAERAARGLAALRWDDGLAALATDWSHTMAATQNFAHRPKGATAGFAVPAACCWENIYYVGGASLSASRVHDGWMRSTGHRNNILSPEVTVFGAGIVCGPNGLSYATENFGTEAWKGLGTPQTAAEPRAPLAADDIACP